MMIRYFHPHSNSLVVLSCLRQAKYLMNNLQEVSLILFFLKKELINKNIPAATKQKPIIFVDANIIPKKITANIVKIPAGIRIAPSPVIRKNIKNPNAGASKNTGHVYSAQYQLV